MKFIVFFIFKFCKGINGSRGDHTKKFFERIFKVSVTGLKKVDTLVKKIYDVSTIPLQYQLFTYFLILKKNVTKAINLLTDNYHKLKKRKKNFCNSDPLSDVITSWMITPISHFALLILHRIKFPHTPNYVAIDIFLSLLCERNIYRNSTCTGWPSGLYLWEKCGVVIPIIMERQKKKIIKIGKNNHYKFVLGFLYVLFFYKNGADENEKKTYSFI